LGFQAIGFDGMNLLTGAEQVAEVFFQEREFGSFHAVAGLDVLVQAVEESVLSGDLFGEIPDAHFFEGFDDGKGLVPRASGPEEDLPVGFLELLECQGHSFETGMVSEVVGVSVGLDHVATAVGVLAPRTSVTLALVVFKRAAVFGAFSEVADG
jgi:hypothetical protein